MNEMKKVIDSIISNTNSISSESKNFLEDTQPKKNKNLIIDKPSNIKENQFQDVTELVNENESLSIELKEKELIIKALLKNKNKRKYAAKDLGISERTLYRKIKNYNLDKSH